ncbi:MAG TPA: serine protease [Herpetosiphon sp.]|uniref:Serine protease n=1 Tax=Herpetosiphon aurantiacus (strain ATCC 23779 / DSM 785 / 114-95) TaxID=316274 RepID=A9B5R1_HERA2|nr:serine protease [Herpetosiphon sp.]ABX04294.1 peptidase S1 and S6 chymotrypsin/Hap [Herpetosiphon aurantiacus DSM 785]HBW51897.1 serine protease [Herpetosiphon sp.]
MHLSVRRYARVAVVLSVLGLSLAQGDVTLAKKEVEAGVDPHTIVASDGKPVDVITDGIVYDQFGAYIAGNEGTGVLAEDDRAEAVDPNALPATQSGSQEGLNSVIGTDNRVRITATTSDPYRRIGQITFSSGGGNYICTGWLISANTVATAGHCLWSNNAWVTNVKFYPGRNGTSNPYGGCNATKLFTVSQWQTSGSPNYDYGAFKINCSVGSQTGWFGLRAPSNTGLVGQVTNIAGYPGDKTSGTMWFHADTVRSYTSLRLSYANDTYGGQSGSPIWNSSGSCTNCSIGVHTNGGTTTNSGTRITSTVLSNFNTWINTAP